MIFQEIQFLHIILIIFIKNFQMQIKKSKNKIYILNNLYMKEILIYLLKTNLLIQDMSLDTPLHKLAKFNDKLFFIKIFLN